MYFSTGYGFLYDAGLDMTFVNCSLKYWPAHPTRVVRDPLVFDYEVGVAEEGQESKEEEA